MHSSNYDVSDQIYELYSRIDFANVISSHRLHEYRPPTFAMSMLSAIVTFSSFSDEFIGLFALGSQLRV